MQISIGNKFTQIHLDAIIEQYWEASLLCSETELISFDLTSIEWIALEEITFLFGWFRYLILKNKKIKIYLPRYDQNLKTHNTLKSLWGKWKIYSFYYSLLDAQGNLEDYFNVDNRINQIINAQIAKEERLMNNHDDLDDDITVVPFQAISTAAYGEISSIDSFVINKIHKPLNLAAKVYHVLEKHTELPPRENLLLSKIIANELFLNVIHHAVSDQLDKTLECYFAISLKRKITKEAILKSETYKMRVNEEFLHSKSNKETVNMSDEEVEKKLLFYLKTVLPSGYESEKSREILPFYKKTALDEYPYRNETFIEFTFLDFGQGIPTTIIENYTNNVELKDVKRQLSEYHNEQHIDSRLLEYAFLLNSSRHPLDIDIQEKYEVPRGLYYLIDIIRRYNGLLVVRSRCGKITYDFSNNVNEIREAIRFSEEKALPDFKGTMISIVIPANQTFLGKVGAIKPTFNLTDSKVPRSSFYYAMIDLINNAESDLRERQEGNIILQDLYHAIFNILDSILLGHRNVPSLVIIDCMGFNVFPIKHKLLHFLASSPYITEVTNVVLLNFNDLDIIEDVKNSIAFKLRNSIDSNFLYKPLPIINSDEEIYWIGVINKQDEAKLNELLIYEDHYIATSDLSVPNIYGGSFLKTDKYGNIRSSMMTRKDILKFTKKKDEN